MKYLALDTSGKRLTILIKKDSEYFVYTDADCGVSHSVEVMPKIEQLVEQANLDLSQVDFFASVTGAGSFTGIRIGVSTIKALCLAYQKKAVAVTSFDTIAYNKKDEKVLAVINAGHGGYYACGYNNGRVEIEPCYVLADRLQELEKEYKILGFEDIDGFNTQVEDNVKGFRLAVDDKASELIDADILCPLYVRKSQAEEGRK